MKVLLNVARKHPAFLFFYAIYLALNARVYWLGVSLQRDAAKTGNTVKDFGFVIVFLAMIALAFILISLINMLVFKTFKFYALLMLAILIPFLVVYYF